MLMSQAICNDSIPVLIKSLFVLTIVYESSKERKDLSSRVFAWLILRVAVKSSFGKQIKVIFK